jgi:hypothetical protein
MRICRLNTDISSVLLVLNTKLSVICGNLLPITNRDEKIIYRSVIPLADDLLYVCQLHFVSFRFFTDISSVLLVLNTKLSVICGNLCDSSHNMWKGTIKLRTENETKRNTTKRKMKKRNETKWSWQTYNRSSARGITLL